MNTHFHKVIFSKRLGTLVAVGEHASAQGKSASGEGARGAVLAATMLLAGLSSAYALDPSALPTGHQVAAGQVQVTTSGARMDIDQFTDKAIVNWQSFNVGSGASVQIQQPSASAVLLNRVVGNDMSQIRGQISANGQVVLVNPNGIVMGPTGRITASAFTASTFGISDANFLAGKMHFERNGSDASVINEGSIQTTGEAGGYIALIGASVSNQGTIASQGAGVAMASGERATVSVPLSGKVRLELDPAAFGSASVANSGVIQTEGGQVFMRAAAVVDAISQVADARVTHTGTIDTTGEQGGRVDILADHGTVRVSGTVTANSTSGAAGADVYIGRDEHTNVLAAVGDASGATLESRGGFVETSGSHLKTSGTRVSAQDWLLDPYNITIASGPATTPTPDYTNHAPTSTSTILAEDIVANLNAGTNVTITTAGAGSDAGDITVNADIIKTTAGTASLTLRADNHLTLNKKIGAGAGATGLNVTLLAGQSSATTTTGQLSIATGGSIEAKAGNVILQTKGGQISTAAGATVTGAHIALDNTNGSVGPATGLITKGTSAGASGTNAITIGDSITATGQLSLYGLTANNSAISLAAGKALTGGNIQAVGDSGAVFGFNVGSGASIVTTANAGNNLITAIGRSTGGGGSGTLALIDVTIRAATGSTLEIKGQATGVTGGAPGNTRGIRIDGVVNTYGAITLTGESGSTEGVLVQAGQINVREGSLTINGTMTPNGGGWRNGITLSRPVYLYNSTHLTLVGKAANTGAMSLNQSEYGVGIGATIASAAGQTGGDVSITGYTSSAQNSFGVVINAAINTGGNIQIIGQNLGNSTNPAIRVNSNLTSGTGDVTIQSIGGRIEHNSSSTITAKNIAIDNSGAGLTSLIADTTAGLSLVVGTAMGGSMDTSTKAITPGTGQHVLPESATASHNVALSLSGTLSASNHVHLIGNKSLNGVGVNIASTAVIGSSGVGADITLGSNQNIAHAGAIRATGSNGTGATIGLSSSLGGISGLGTVGNSTHLHANVSFEQGATSTFSGTVYSSTFTKSGAGRLQLAGQLLSNVSNQVDQGTLQIGTGGTTGSVTSGVLVSSGATLDIQRSDTYTLSTIVTGGGSLVQSGSGTTVLTGANTYTGSTSVSAGTLQIGNGGSTGTLGTGAVVLSNGATIDWNRSAATSIFNSISGTGNVSAAITGANSHLTLAGSINLTDGTIDLASEANLLVNQAIANDSTSASAITLQAGSSTAAGTSTGGDVILSGSGSLSVGSGGRATVYTGSISGSTGLTIAAGNSRFNSKLGTSNFSTALGTGTHVVYREARTITGSASNVTKTYDANAYNTTALTWNGFVNNDSAAQLSSLSFTGTAEGAVNAGSYTISATATNGLGYTVTTTGANLTIAQAHLTLSGTRDYDGSTTFAGTHLTATGVGGQTFAITGLGDTSNLASKHVQSNQTLSSLTGLSLGASSNGGLSANYLALSTTGSSVSVTPKAATVTASNTTPTYNGNLQTQADASTSGFIGGDSITVGGLASGTNAATYTSALSVSGADATNYDVTFTQGTLTIERRDITLQTLVANNKVFDGNTSASITGATFSNLVGSETLGLSGSGTFADAAIGNNKTVTVPVVANLTQDNGTGRWQNYNLTTSGSFTTLASITAEPTPAAPGAGWIPERPDTEQLNRRAIDHLQSRPEAQASAFTLAQGTTPRQSVFTIVTCGAAIRPLEQERCWSYAQTSGSVNN